MSEKGPHRLSLRSHDLSVSVRENKEKISAKVFSPEDIVVVADLNTSPSGKSVFDLRGEMRERALDSVQTPPGDSADGGDTEEQDDQ